MKSLSVRAALVLLVGTLLTTSAKVEAQPWREFVDDVSGEVCGLVNAANTELVVLADTGQFVIVSSGGQDVTDVLLADTFVALDGTVETPFGSAGFIKFETDADGFASLFWVDLTGRVFDVDGFTGEPVLTDSFPSEFANVPCDACPFWDDPNACVAVIDDDRDGIPDDVDDCLDTPVGESIDAGGCSCSQLDGDGDGIDDCDDFCPDTPNVVSEVDVDGCACFEIDSDGDGVDDCDDFCPDTPSVVSDVDADGCACFEIDSDGDGVDDCDDFCPDTPSVVTEVDVDGCACFESLDSDNDGDGVDNCDDLCPGTRSNVLVDSDGCSVVVSPPPIIIGVCGNFIGAPLMVMFAGLGLVRFGRARRGW